MRILCLGRGIAALVLSPLFLLSGCDDDDVVAVIEQLNNKPVARLAADNFEPVERSQVQLDASASFDSDNDPLTFRWERVSGPSLDLTGASGAMLSITAPDVASDRSLVIRVIASDGQAEDDATITLDIVNNEPPTARLTASNFAPKEGDTVSLDASASFDPENDALTYTWDQVSGPTVVFSATTGDSVDVTVPEVTQDSAAVIRVTASDGFDEDDATVTLNIKYNEAPTARAVSDDYTLEEGQAFTLNASTSTDPEGDPLTYTWEQVSGPMVDLTDAQGASVDLSAPEVSSAEIVMLRVVVSDGNKEDAVNINLDVRNIFTEPRSRFSANLVRTYNIGKGARLVYVREEINKTFLTYSIENPSTPENDVKFVRIEFDLNNPELFTVDTTAKVDGAISPDVYLKALDVPNYPRAAFGFIAVDEANRRIDYISVLQDLNTGQLTYTKRGSIDISGLSPVCASTGDSLVSHPASGSANFNQVPSILLGHSNGDGITRIAPVFIEAGTDGQGQPIYVLDSFEVVDKPRNSGSYCMIEEDLQRGEHNWLDFETGLYSGIIRDSRSSIRIRYPATNRTGLKLVPSFSENPLYYTNGENFNPHYLISFFFSPGNHQLSSRWGQVRYDWYGRPPMSHTNLVLDSPFPSVPSRAIGESPAMTLKGSPELALYDKRERDTANYLELGLGAGDLWSANKFLRSEFNTITGTETFLLVAFPKQGELRYFNLEK